MGLFELLILLVVAAICGGIGQSLVGYEVGGCLPSIAVGFIGAYLGLLMARELGLPEFIEIQVGGQAFPIIWSILGAAAFSLILALLNRVFVRR